MADLKENFQSYRVVWNISAELYSDAAFLRSQKFKIGESEWTLEMCKQPGFRFALRGSCRQPVLRTSYYLLSTDINKKLEKVNTFLTDWLYVLHRIPGDIVLVCTIDVRCESALRNTEHWLEGNTRKNAELYTFKKMTPERIVEIAEIIEKSFSDSLVSKQNDHVQSSEAPQDLHTEVIPTLLKHEMTDAIAATPIIEKSEHSGINCQSPADKLLTKCVQCFKEKKFCDITIQVLPGGHKIHAHKLVLISGSTAWKQLLDDDQQLSVIAVPDLDLHAVNALVTFIYDGSVPDGFVPTDQLLIAAATYGVDSLKTWCEEQLIATITIETAINLMMLSHQYNAPSLFDETIIFVRQNIAVLKQREEWKSLFFSFPELAMDMVNNLY